MLGKEPKTELGADSPTDNRSGEVESAHRLRGLHAEGTESS